MSVTPRSYNFGRKLDGTIATEQDWERWREEFWEKELKTSTKESKKEKYSYKKT